MEYGWVLGNPDSPARRTPIGAPIGRLKRSLQSGLSGGRGTIVGTVLAVFVVGVLQNGLIQLDVDSFWIEVAQGVLLVGAVTFD